MCVQTPCLHGDSAINFADHILVFAVAQDGDPACNPNNWNSGATTSKPATFAPTSLNTTQWVEAYQALGATSAVLTAKHGCGFLLWPSNVTIPSGAQYPYSVGRSDSAYHGDVVAQFVASTKAAGLGHGFYYSLKDNYYLNVPGGGMPANGSVLPGQVKVTSEQYLDIVIGHLGELWGGNYGDLAE